jgi:acyl dehydratase
MDLEYIRRESVFGTRVAPAVLTFGIAEGLALQTGILHGTGLALLRYDVRVRAPVAAGDTIRVEIEVAARRETRKPDRGVVTFEHRVLNQRGEVVLEATITRLILRRVAA